MMPSIGCGGIFLFFALLVAVPAELMALVLRINAWVRRRPTLGLVANWIAVAATPPMMLVLLNAVAEKTGTSEMDWEVFAVFTLALAAVLTGTGALSFPPTGEAQRRRWRIAAVAFCSAWLLLAVFLTLRSYRAKHHDQHLREQLDQSMASSILEPS